LVYPFPLLVHGAWFFPPLFSSLSPLFADWRPSLGALTRPFSASAVFLLAFPTSPFTLVPSLSRGYYPPVSSGFFSRAVPPVVPLVPDLSPFQSSFCDLSFTSKPQKSVSTLSEVFSFLVPSTAFRRYVLSTTIRVHAAFS